MAVSRGPVITLQGGPDARLKYYEEDFLERIRARAWDGPHSPGHGRRSLGYERPAHGKHLDLAWRELPPAPGQAGQLI